MKLSIEAITNAVYGLTGMIFVITGLVAYLYGLTPATFMHYHPFLFVVLFVALGGHILLQVIAYARCEIFANAALQQLEALKDIVRSAKQRGSYEK